MLIFIVLDLSLWNIKVQSSILSVCSQKSWAPIVSIGRKTWCLKPSCVEKSSVYSILNALGPKHIFGIYDILTQGF